MFEFAAGHVQQEERERQIAAGLRRRELLAAAPVEARTHDRQPSTIQRRAQTPVRAHAER